MEGVVNQDEIINKIVKALRLVPEFDGNCNTLIRFLALCDKLVVNYINPAPGNELGNLALINGILNKITGAAARTLVTNGIPKDWNGIRSTLIHNFSDHRDESALYSDMSLLAQGSDTPQVFYERVQNMLSTIMTYVELHDSLETTVEAKRSLYKKLALQTFLKGLSEPLGSRIRCMRPPSLEKALEFAQEEMNIVYLQQKLPPQHSRKPFGQENQPSSSRNFPPLHAFNFRNPFIPQNMNNQPPRPVQGPSRTQQMFRALPRSNMSTGFRIVPRQPQSPNNHPRPMSGISHPVARPLPPTRQDWRIHGNPPPNNYFKTREINSNEIFDYSEDYSYDGNDFDSYYNDYVVHEPEYDTYQLTHENPDTQTTESDTANTNSQNFINASQKTAPE